MKRETKFGLINETYMSLRSPRGIDEGPFESLLHALKAAGRVLSEDCEEVAVVQCRYSERLECWIEVSGGGSITIDARNAGALLCEDEDGEAEAEAAVENT